MKVQNRELQYDADVTVTRTCHIEYNINATQTLEVIEQPLQSHQ